MLGELPARVRLLSASLHIRHFALVGLDAQRHQLIVRGEVVLPQPADAPGVIANYPWELVSVRVRCMAGSGAVNATSVGVQVALAGSHQAFDHGVGVCRGMRRLRSVGRASDAGFELRQRGHEVSKIQILWLLSWFP